MKGNLSFPFDKPFLYQFVKTGNGVGVEVSDSFTFLKSSYNQRFFPSGSSADDFNPFRRAMARETLRYRDINYRRSFFHPGPSCSPMGTGIAVVRIRLFSQHHAWETLWFIQFCGTSAHLA